MDWNNVFELIDPELLIVVAACWVIGYVLKQTPNIPDWSIVYIVTGFAILSAILMFGLTVESVIQGILCGAFAVYGHQIVKQSTNRDGDAE